MNLQMVICQSMNVGWLLRTLPAVTCSCPYSSSLTPLCLEVVGTLKHCSCMFNTLDYWGVEGKDGGWLMLPSLAPTCAHLHPSYPLGHFLPACTFYGHLCPLHLLESPCSLIPFVLRGGATLKHCSSTGRVVGVFYMVVSAHLCPLTAKIWSIWFCHMWVQVGAKRMSRHNWAWKMQAGSKGTTRCKCASRMALGARGNCGQ